MSPQVPFELQAFPDQPRLGVEGASPGPQESPPLVSLPPILVTLVAGAHSGVSSTRPGVPEGQAELVSRVCALACAQDMVLGLSP